MIVIRRFKNGTLTVPDNRTLVFSLFGLTIMNTTNRSVEAEIAINEIDMIWHTKNTSIVYEEREW